MSKIPSSANNSNHVEFWITQILSSLCLHYGPQLRQCHSILRDRELANLHFSDLLQLDWKVPKISTQGPGFYQFCTAHATFGGNCSHPHWICLHSERLWHLDPATERRKEKVVQWFPQANCEERDEKCSGRRNSKLNLIWITIEILHISFISVFAIYSYL